MPIALIVEDEPEANTLLAMLVQLRGYETDSAYAGKEALAKIDREPPDLVFLDLMLPDLNGYDVCSTLKRHRSTALLPIVIVTARVAVENRIQSYILGADDYVPKPYTPDEIFQAIDSTEDWKRRIDQLAVEGGLPLHANDEGESLRRIGQFQSLLTGRSPFDPTTAAQLGDSLRNLARQADVWGRENKVIDVASMGYQLLPDGLKITLRDLAGWFWNDPGPVAERWAKAIASAKFDEITTDATGEYVTFLKRFG